MKGSNDMCILLKLIYGLKYYITIQILCKLDYVLVLWYYIQNPEVKCVKFTLKFKG